MENIYQESKDYLQLIEKNNELDNYNKVLRFEGMLEESASIIFAFHSDRDIFKFNGIPKCGRLAVNKISEKISEVLTNNRVQKLNLLNLYDVTLEVHELTKHYPSVKRIINTEKDEEQYIKSLAYFVARHILIHKYRMNKITSEDMRTIVGDYLDIRNASNGIYIGMHQISNKLIDGNLSPKEAMEKLEEVMWERRIDLAKRAIAYNGGYLHNKSQIIQMDKSNNEILKFNYANKKKPKLRDVE